MHQGIGEAAGTASSPTEAPCMTTATKIAAAKPAVVLIAPRSDFLSPGGTMYALIKDEGARRR